MSDQGRIVVGIDGSEPAKEALRWAAALARSLGGHIEAVTAWHVPSVASPSGGWAPLPTDRDLARDARQMQHLTLVEVFGDQWPEGLQATVRHGNAAEVLLDASADARLLVVGRRGGGGFARLLLGSVSAACAEHATCPVLVVDSPPPLAAVPSDLGPAETGRTDQSPDALDS